MNPLSSVTSKDDRKAVLGLVPTVRYTTSASRRLPSVRRKPPSGCSTAFCPRSTCGPAAPSEPKVKGRLEAGVMQEAF